jgi:proteasome lid subunit RPN8/RPN11
MDHVVRIRGEVVSRMMEEARREPSVECCGVLGGRGGVISAILPARNALASPSEFEIAPEELFRIFRELRASRLDHLGIYHSHPAGDNAPSARDIERAFYPDAAYFVVSPLPDAPRPVRAFSIREGRVTELAIEALG